MRLERAWDDGRSDPLAMERFRYILVVGVTEGGKVARLTASNNEGEHMNWLVENAVEQAGAAAMEAVSHALGKLAKGR